MEAGNSVDDERLNVIELIAVIPSYLKTVSIAALYDTIFDIQAPLIDGLFQRGTYLFEGPRRWGKVL